MLSTARSQRQRPRRSGPQGLIRVVLTQTNTVLVTMLALARFFDLKQSCTYTIDVFEIITQNSSDCIDAKSQKIQGDEEVSRAMHMNYNSGMLAAGMLFNGKIENVVLTAASVYTDENTQQSVPDSNCSEGSGTINEDSNLSFADTQNTNPPFSQDADNDSNEADMRLAMSMVRDEKKEESNLKKDSGDSNSSATPTDQESDDPPAKKTKSSSVESS
ncbi:aspartate and serine-rich protein-like [Argopecten irradians]|uniref:aspartate and serine-rich protein-like n=1 Tax=Argopecten irradians TaxID=31199 RepID=UPI00371E6E4C